MAPENSLKRTSDVTGQEAARKKAKASSAHPSDGSVEPSNAGERPLIDADTTPESHFWKELNDFQKEINGQAKGVEKAMKEVKPELDRLKQEMEEMKRQIEALKVGFRVMGPRPVRRRADSGVGTSLR